jgi:dipeptidase E
MKFYLSSYQIGDHSEKFSQMLECTNKRIGYIPNARDFSVPNVPKQADRTRNDIKNLEKLGAEVEVLDLRKFFDKQEELDKKLKTLAGVWVSGGNTFILRQAFFLSGFDKWLKKNIREDFVYGAYSAGCCILGPSLKGLQIVDDPSEKPYEKQTPEEILWSGLNILDYYFLPHYDSNHHESADIDKEIAFAIENKMLFKAFRDGEVEVFER